MLRGLLIAESMRVGSKLDLHGLRLVSVSRWDVSATVSASQPKLWTAIHFEANDEEAARLAGAIAEIMEPTGGWYCDFTVAEDHVVVFADRVFRYTRGEAAGRAEAEAYGKKVGVPVHQLDWPD